MMALLGAASAYREQFDFVISTCCNGLRYRVVGDDIENCFLRSLNIGGDFMRISRSKA